MQDKVAYLRFRFEVYGVRSSANAETRETGNVFIKCVSCGETQSCNLYLLALYKIDHRVPWVFAPCTSLAPR